MLFWGIDRFQSPFGFGGWNKKPWAFVSAMIMLGMVLESFSVKLWSNAPNTEM